MATQEIRTQERDGLARFLGWFSIGLGTAQVMMPRTMCGIVGADDSGLAPRVMRLMGARELAQGSGILTRPRPTGSSGHVSPVTRSTSRRSASSCGKGRKRTAFAIAKVRGRLRADDYEARLLSAKQGRRRAASAFARR